ncbi:hypothetical protein J2X97_000330 [Epilithonimonas hungarica]|nr:hypothetical protein [Epilithonimonas hungarica]
MFNETICIDFQGRCYPVYFYEADLFELNKALLNAKTKYPLIWLQTGYSKKERTNSGRIELDNLSFFIITKGDQTDRYDKRFATSFHGIVYPIIDGFLNIIKSRSGIGFGSNDYTTTDLPFNDVAELMTRQQKAKPQTASVPDIWDATILDIDLTVHPDCYPEYYIKNLKQAKIC